MSFISAFTSGDFASTAASESETPGLLGQASGCLSFTKSLDTKKPCSRLSMPMSTASRYVTEHRLIAPQLDAIRDQIKAMKAFPAIVGPISMGPDNDVTKTIYILQAKQNKWTLVDKYPAK